jgi:tetratricopeptide (TPR) repeat protein
MMVVVSDREVLEQRVLAGDGVLARDGESSDPAARGRVAQALLDKGQALVELGRHDEAAACFAQLVAEFGDSVEADMRERLVVALACLVRELMVLGRIDEAVQRADELDDRFRDADSSEARRVVVEGLDAGVAACDALAERDRGEVTLSVCSKVAAAMWLKALLLGKGGHEARELAAVEELLDRFGDSTEPRLRVPVARARYNRGVLLRDLGQHNEALDAWGELVDRFAADPPSGEPFIVLDGLYARSHQLSELNRSAEAVTGCVELIDSYGDDERPPAQLKVAQALGLKAHVLAKAGNVEGALAVDDELLARFEDAVDADLRERVARTLLHKTSLLLRAGRSDEAVAASELLVTRFESETDPKLIAQVGDHLLKAAATLLAGKRRQAILAWVDRANHGRLDQGLRILDVVAAHLRDAATPELRELVVSALLERSSALARLGHLPQAFKVYDEVLNLGEPAIAPLENLANRAEQSDGSYARERAVSALFSRAVILQGLGHRDETLAAVDDIIERFEHDKSPLTKILVKKAREQRQEIRGTNDSR